MNRTRQRRSPDASDQGSAAVEFAILLPALLLLILGTIEFGRIYWARTTVQYAIDDAARYAMINTAATATQIRDRALASAIGLPAEDLSFTVDLSEVGYVSIAGQYDFDPIAGSTFIHSIQLQTATRVPRS